MKLHRLRIWPALLLALCVAAPLLACNVPVFRYALERWNPDAYEVFVFFDRAASAEQRRLVDALDAQVVGRDQQLDSFFITEVDVKETMDNRAKAVFAAVKPTSYPHIVVAFPRSQPSDPPVFSGPLSREAVEHLADSPVRREIAKRIFDGESVVWLLVECGDKAKDDQAAALLTAELDRLKGQLKLPELDETDDAFHDPEAGPKMRLSFSLLRMERGDAREAMFLRLLEEFDAKQIDRSQPMAFAVFGRGRVMPPLYGKYLSPKFIEEACSFLIGRCSCQVKEENPGWDLLMPVDWEGVMKGRIALTEATPKLTSPAAALHQNEVIESAVKATATVASDHEPSGGRMGPTEASPLLRNLLFVTAAGLLLVAVGTMWLRLRRTD